jgi:Uma2 family endonuclease
MRGMHATLADMVGLMEREEAVELVGGEIVRKHAAPIHGAVQVKLCAAVGPFNRKSGGPHGPGGWSMMCGAYTLYSATQEIFRHDLSGYHRERHEARPNTWPVEARPDWVCEILSPSTARYDVVKKQRTLHAAGVPYYWLIDPEGKTLSVLRHSPDGYVAILTAEPGEKIHAQPFDAIEIETDELFGEV